MQLRKHEVAGALGAAEKDILKDTLSEAVALKKDCINIYRALKDFRENGGDEFDLLDNIEPCSTLNTTVLWRYCHCRFSVSDIVSKYLDRMFDVLSVFKSNLGKAIDAAFCIEDSELELLEGQAYKIASSCLFFLLVEFDVFSSIGDDSASTSIDETIVLYCQVYNKQPARFCAELFEESKEFHPKFDVFDGCPELEIEFQKVMGPLIVGIDEEDLTLDIVEGVIRGEIEPDVAVVLTNRGADVE